MAWWSFGRSTGSVPQSPPSPGGPSVQNQRIAAPPPPESTGEEDLRGYVHQLQKDARLLMRFIVRRPDRVLPAGVTTPAMKHAANDPLLADPAAIAKDEAKFSALVALAEDLSMRAAPATPNTLRLTYAYLRIPAEGGEPPASFASQASCTRVSMIALAGWSVLSFLLAIAILIHLTEGQNVMKQLDRQRAVLDGFATQLALVAGQSQRQAGSLCEAMATDTDKASGGQVVPANAGGATNAQLTWQIQDICNRRSNVEREMQITYAKIADWNCVTSAVAPWVPNHTGCSTLASLPRDAWTRLDPWFAGFRGADWPVIEAVLSNGSAATAPPGEAPETSASLRMAWNSTEIRTLIYISSISGFVMPMLAGMLGGCIYALRRFDTKIGQATLDRSDHIRCWLRVLMAAITGGLLGVVWTADQPINIGGVSLSLTAMAFFIGFSLEVFFTVIEAMVDSVASRMRGWTPDPGFLMAAQQRMPLAVLPDQAGDGDGSAAALAQNAPPPTDGGGGQANSSPPAVGGP